MRDGQNSKCKGTVLEELKTKIKVFLGGLVAKINAGGLGFISGLGTIAHRL